MTVPTGQVGHLAQGLGVHKKLLRGLPETSQALAGMLEYSTARHTARALQTGRWPIVNSSQAQAGADCWRLQISYELLRRVQARVPEDAA